MSLGKRPHSAEANTAASAAVNNPPDVKTGGGDEAAVPAVQPARFGAGRTDTSGRGDTPGRAETSALPEENGAASMMAEKVQATYQREKDRLFNLLVSTIDMQNLLQLDREKAKKEIVEISSEIIDLKSIKFTGAQKLQVLAELCDEMLGYGPLEALLARDDIADLMVNGYNKVYIEVKGKIEQVNVKFRNDKQLLNICQRIVSQMGRRVDESSPICDARLPDGSRVNVIVPPLAIDGPTLTIRKFKKDKLKLKNLVEFGSISKAGAQVLSIIGQVRCNILISGGTGSGKTTLLNCMTGFIEEDERVITCEDAAELQLQQPHVVRLETRPAGLEGKGEVTMRDLVKNCLRMRPERIIVGEVRGPEAFDLLQAMNTGHDGSMGTLHANSPREGISRLESMITMGGFALPAKTIREMIVSSVNIIVQASRLRDGSRKITHITEVVGMEGDTVITQDLMVYKITGEDAEGKLRGVHAGTGIMRPRMYERAQYYGRGRELIEALEAASAEAP